MYLIPADRVRDSGDIPNLHAYNANSNNFTIFESLNSFIVEINKNQITMIYAFLFMWMLFANTGAKNYPAPATKIAGYNLTKADNYWTLPDILKEISGIVSVDGSSVACVQDEKGTVFIYNFKNNKITSNIKFNDDGDYEDLALVNKTIYILKSDGNIYESASLSSDNEKARKTETKVPSEDNEGLCYDHVTKKLLIGCKGDIKNDKYKNKRAIYVFDQNKKSLSSKPFLVIDPKVIKKFLAEKYRNSGKNDDDDDFDIDFRMSAIGIHPITKKIFVVCASDFLICVFNRDGVPENIELLDRKLFNKTEGIAFLPNGDVLFSNEGENGKPSLMRFNYKSKQ